MRSEQGKNRNFSSLSIRLRISLAPCYSHSLGGCPLSRFYESRTPSSDLVGKLVMMDFMRSVCVQGAFLIAVAPESIKFSMTVLEFGAIAPGYICCGRMKRRCRMVASEMLLLNLNTLSRLMSHFVKCFISSLLFVCFLTITLYVYVITSVYQIRRS